MTTLFQLVSSDTYKAAVANGYIKTQTHPTAPYTIHNYTDVCTWDQAWDEATLNCRGLITDNLTGNVIARGMAKFFNSDQEQAPRFELDDEVIVSDKMDGSLGILYYLPDYSEAIATRGSFASEQAIWATNWWRENRPPLALVAGETYLFEIIYPENRIVVDYGGKEGLVFLGTVNNETGLFTAGWITETDCAPRYSYNTWGEVLAAPERPNAEGFVITRVSDGAMAKVKYEDYKRLHKYMTRVTERHVWETLFAGKSLDEEFAGAPDEFHVWIRQVADNLHAQYALLEDTYTTAYAATLQLLPDPDNYTRKDFAMIAKDSKYSAALFLLEDKRPLNETIWKNIKPEGGRTFKVVSSDAD